MADRRGAGRSPGLGASRPAGDGLPDQNAAYLPLGQAVSAAKLHDRHAQPRLPPDAAVADRPLEPGGGRNVDLGAAVALTQAAEVGFTEQIEQFRKLGLLRNRFFRAVIHAVPPLIRGLFL